jgi:lipoprotein-releasing system permease protein
MTSGFGWSSWVSRRFLTGRRGGRGRLIFIFSVILISTGVATLNTILSVMNGLQQGYIRSILEIGSYHLRWTPDPGAAEGSVRMDDLVDIISADQTVSLTAVFREGQTMLSGERPRPMGALVRGAPESLYADDTALAEFMDIVDGEFDLSGRSIVLGDELAASLGVSPGDTVTALDLGGPGMTPAEIVLNVSAVFRCGYREYESSLAFTSLDTVSLLFGPAVPEIGIKLNRLERDRAVLSRLTPLLAGYSGELTSWRDNNRSFFGALRTEKMMMLLLLALIFVVVAVNIDHSLRRMATERVEDLSILKAVGATPRDIRILFLRQGLVIGGTGGVIGSVFGVLIGSNVDTILSVVRRIRYAFSGLFGIDSFRSHPVEAFFRSSEVMTADVLTILLLAVLMSSLAAVRAASLAAGQKPAEVLRSE